MKRFISLCLLLAILLTISTPLTVKAQVSEPPEDYLGKARNLMANMTPEQRIGQLFLVSFKGTEIGPNTGIYRLITEYAIGGVVLRADNDNFVGPTNTVPRAADLVRGLHEIAWTQSAAGPGAAAESPAYIPLFVGISQEGDLYPTDQIINGLTAIPSPMAIGATWDPQLAQAAGLVMGKELRAIGFNLFIGPSLDVLDVPPSFNSDDLGIRTFGGDPFWVGEMGKAYIRGLHLGSRVFFMLRAELGVSVGQGGHLTQVHRGRSPEPPVPPTQRRDPIQIDRLRVPDSKRVLQQQHDRVDHILLIDLDDLHLLEQQLGQGQGW